MDSARGGCLPSLASTDVIAGRHAQQSARVKGRRRKPSIDEANVAGTSSYQDMWPGGMNEDEVMNDLLTKMAHIQWRKHANDKLITDFWQAN